MSKLGIIWDLNPVPSKILAEGRKQDNPDTFTQIDKQGVENG